MFGLHKRPRQPEIELNQRVDLWVPDDKLMLEGELGCILEIIRKDKNGNVVEAWKKRSESFVEGFLRVLMLQMEGTSLYDGRLVRNTGGSWYEACSHSYNFATDAATSVYSYGIQVGTGSTSPTITDYNIQTIITHGVGSGQLQYGAMTYGLPATTSTTAHFTQTRVFSNDGPSSVTVNEVALAGRFQGSTAGVAGTVLYYIACFVHDLISGGQAVPVGESITVNYRYMATV